MLAARHGLKGYKSFAVSALVELVAGVANSVSVVNASRQPGAASPRYEKTSPGEKMALANAADRSSDQLV
jgi:hypothetical protein